MKRNNRGLTLIELVVVVSIVALLASLSALAFSSVTLARQKQCAVSVSALISRTRIGCLSKSGGADLELSMGENGTLIGKYIEGGTLISTETLPAQGLTIRCTFTRTQTGEELVRDLSEAPLRLSFLRSTGAQEARDGYVCTSIQFLGIDTRTLTLIPSTGAQTLK